ncbi:MAG: hypothetical protein COB66_06490 [Coxiella sp. (in: Bacteria)]|nr:MAG: hypothetical protein COB66_06490 [Coxiella sp. (in: g-proteobacteria)]
MPHATFSAPILLAVGVIATVSAFAVPPNKSISGSTTILPGKTTTLTLTSGITKTSKYLTTFLTGVKLQHLEADTEKYYVPYIMPNATYQYNTCCIYTTAGSSIKTDYPRYLFPAKGSRHLFPYT